MKSEHDLLPRVEAHLEDMGYKSVRLLDVKTSTQSDLQLLEATSVQDGPARFVLKVFSDRCEWNTSDAIRAEFQALERLFGRLKDIDGVACPRPIALFDSNRAYLMSFLAGRGLSTLLDSGAAIHEGVATKLLRGLALFHEETGEIYGDFHSDNVIVGDAGLVGLVDPTIADPNYYRPEHRLHDRLGTDLGYWLHTVASRSPKMIARNPNRARRRVDFTIELFQQAVRDLSPAARESVLQNILVVARGHLHLMGRRQLRGRVLEPLALCVASTIMRRVRSGHPGVS